VASSYKLNFLASFTKTNQFNLSAKALTMEHSLGYVHSLGLRKLVARQRVCELRGSEAAAQPHFSSSNPQPYSRNFLQLSKMEALAASNVAIFKQA
jgi:hypothetical protein